MKLNISKEWFESKVDLEKDCEVGAGVPIIANTLNEGTYRVTNQDGTTGTIVVPPGASLTIWTQSTIERV